MSITLLYLGIAVHVTLGVIPLVLALALALYIHYDHRQSERNKLLLLSW